jgi:DNA-binding transcriptional LysR family regulator
MQVKPPPTPAIRAVLGQLSDMDLRLLQVFKSVVECGGMSAAELELNIGTSTVSRHMKDLETRLGLTLCRRGPGGFALTPEGQRVYDETLRLLAAVDGFRSSIDDIHRAWAGSWRWRVRQDRQQPGAHIGEAIALFSARRPT